MLRVYFLQEWQGLADEALEDAIYDSQSMRHFTGIDLSVESVPDATTLLKVPHLLEKHDVTRKIFKQVNALLSEKQRLMRKGTIVDATIIAAAPSTKNKARKRAPEMHQTKKGNPYYFGRKAQVRALVVGHPFHVIQNLFGHRKARCRRLAKNQARLYSLFALANLTFAKRSLLRAIRA